MNPYESVEVRQARYAEIVALRAEGLSYGQIAERYGLSRQRVKQIIDGGVPTGLAGWLGHSARNGADRSS